MRTCSCRRRRAETFACRRLQRVYLLAAEFKRRQREDRWVYEGFIPCFSSEAVQSYLFVVSFVCLHYCTDISFFQVWIFLFLNFGHYWTEAELHADASIVYTEGKGRAASRRFLFGPPHTQPAPQQQDDLRCQECASVHKHNLPLLFLFISVSPTVLPDLFFSFLAFGGFLPNKPKGETRVTILQVYDCSF